MGAVVYRRRGDAGRQTWFDLFQFIRDTPGHFPAVFADEHEYRAHDDFASVLRGRAAAQLTTHLDHRDVTNAQRHTVRLRDDDVAEVGHFDGLARHSHQPLRAVMFDVTRAAVLVVCFD